MIFVASLFSHLALDNWRPWLAKLVSMLTPNGLLVLSTHCMAEYEQLLPTQTVAFHASEPGFVYGGGNETEGRLDGTYYGTAFVTEDFVRREVAVAGGEVTEFTRQGLAQHQDLYVVRKHHDRIASAR